MKIRKWLLLAVASMHMTGVMADNVREKILIDEGWKFAFGNAADPAKDFG